MMSLYDFNRLEENEKGEAVFLTATFIDDRIDKAFRVQLYRLYDFYVEVFYDAAKNELVRYRVFKSLGQLAPYVKLPTGNL